MRAPARAAPGVKAPRSGDHLVTDAPHVVAQDIWGRGNLSPLDVQFGSQAIMSLVPSKGFGFAGLHLGYRLLKYAEDMKASVDAAERDIALTRVYTKKSSSIRNVPWKSGSPAFKANRYESFIVAQASTLNMPLEALYQQSAMSLKGRGKIFAADLMEFKSGAGLGMKLRGVAAGEGWRFHSCEDHVKSIADAGFAIESRFDMSAALLASIRSGFYKSLGALAELRTSDQTDRPKHLAAYLEQIETWGTVYALVEAGKLEATGILAIKQR
jgi:hypothetical protein